MAGFIIVALGGAIGSMLRYGAGLVVARLGVFAFPWVTLGVNVAGSLCIGLVTGLLAQMSAGAHEFRLFVVVGVLGGFTTFSAFSLDAILMLERGQVAQALLYIVASVALSVGAAFLGLVLIRMYV